MSITIFKKKHEIETKEAVFIPNKDFFPPTETKLYNYFFVIGRVNDGARFYSDSIIDYDYAFNIFKLYKDMVFYFGGGEVELIACNKDGYDIIETIHI